MKLAGMPIKGASVRRILTQMEWKVPIQRDFKSIFFSSAKRRDTRWRISSAALLVKVTAKILCGGTFSSVTKLAILWVKTLVLPEPGPAITRDGPLEYLMASSC